MGPQGLSTSDRPRGQLSRQSSEVDYEIAEQLIQHAQGRRDGSGNDVASIASDRKTSPDFTSGDGGQKGDRRAEDSKSRSRQDNRRSSSQERQPEEKYAPINIPVAMGQVCR